jgi:hypothetical protein
MAGGFRSDIADMESRRGSLTNAVFTFPSGPQGAVGSRMREDDVSYRLMTLG